MNDEAHHAYRRGAVEDADPYGEQDETTAASVREATGWPLKVADSVEVIAPPTEDELRVLRDLHLRTKQAHSRPVPLPV